MDTPPAPSGTQETVDSFSSLITALGGPTIVADALGMRSGTVQKMKDRNSIKPKHWPKFVELAEQRGLEGITLGLLMRLSAPSGSPPAETSTQQEQTA
jgi:hypothetical protein